MRWAGLAIIVAICIGASPATQPAASQPSAKKRVQGTERTVQGMVASVEGRVLKISLLRKKSNLTERRIRTNKTTVITLNQKTVPLSTLKAGENVTIKLNRGVATHIDATGK